MTEMNATESSEKKSLNFKARTGDGFKPVSRPNRTDTYI